MRETKTKKHRKKERIGETRTREEKKKRQQERNKKRK
jgi:hypothetical protein